MYLPTSGEQFLGSEVQHSLWS